MTLCSARTKYETQREITRNQHITYSAKQARKVFKREGY
jgi:hypothetical protein